ncbi:phosphatidate cytidylyltransferase [Hymenobacter siberiensis]|uniref:phosphatidate cytidylyltransferase n=1 Tax=Hymenobacter siberiensis TaxID=2848396 RepID=UPI001C1E5AE8|nr:phosphatidate cytidylyltransferase [Hymenobacter siberiensis]MBU6120309.1 phosphatidate cytidylyltransferase [Hymenobacter siberiensis]
MPDSTPPNTSITPEKTGPSNLRLRVIYGLIGAAMLLGSVWFSPWTFGLFFAAVQAVMLWEFYRMMRAGGSKPIVWMGLLMGLLIYVYIYGLGAVNDYFNLPSGGYTIYPPLGEESPFDRNTFLLSTLPKIYTGISVAALAAMVGLVLYEILRWPNGGKPFDNISATYGGLFYVGLPMSFLSQIAFSSGHYDYRRIFALLFLIWASDIGAYAAGKTFGKHKMAPQISPGKTWEGWAGGFVLTLVVGWALGFMLPDMPLTHRLVAAGVVAVFAPLGDLAESMLKRSVGVKDSGSILPGHGGLLDRFDAFLLVLPVLALLQLLAGL